MKPQEDQDLHLDLSVICKHEFIDTYGGNGFSKRTPEEYIIIFFCKKCLTIRKKVIDVSDQLIHPDTLDLYDEGKF